MPETSMVNIHANPSMRRLNSSPYCGAHEATKRMTSPSAMDGYSDAASIVETSATEPAIQDAIFREPEDMKAAHRLAMKGRITIRQRRIVPNSCGSADPAQGLS